VPAISIRRARVEDLPAITEIYNEAVATTIGTFDTEPKSADDRRRWFLGHGPRHPILVSESDGRVVGWAALSPWSDRLAYERTAEIHVYVASAARERGIGTRLVRTLLDVAPDSGIHAILARIASGNDVSLRLHESFGFERVGTLQEVGTKFGRLLDVHLLEYIVPESPRA